MEVHKKTKFQKFSESKTFQAVLLSSGKVITMFTGMVMAAILARLFTKVDYAAYKQTTLVYNFALPFLTLGFPSALYYFIPRNKGKERSVLTSNLILLLPIGILFVLFLWCGGSKLIANFFKNPSLNQLLLVYTPYILLSLPVASLGACLIACKRVKTLVAYNTIFKVVSLICIVSILILWRTPLAAISGIVISMCIMFVPALYLMYKSTGLGNWLPTKENMAEQINYSVPLGLSGLFGIASLYLDKLVVGKLCPPEQFAVYINGAMQLPFISMITGSVTAILIPEFAGMYQRKEYSEILSLWNRAMVKCSLIIFPIMIFLFIMAPSLMRILYSAAYEDSAIPFRIFLLLLPVKITSWGAIFMAAGKNKLFLYRSIMELFLNVGVSIIMIKKFGSIGAAFATVLVVYLWTVTYNIHFVSKILKTHLRMVIPVQTLLKIFILSLLGCASYGLIWFLEPKADLIKLCLFTPLYAIITLVLFDRFKLFKIEDFISIIKSRFNK